MDFLEQVFTDRVAEIDTYLDLLETFEKEIQGGIPRVGEFGVISPTQQRILYSSVYLQLYNLVESTINQISESICTAVLKEDKWQPNDLSKEMRNEWVKFWSKTHSDLNFDNRLISTISMFDHLVQNLPVKQIEISKGGGGNWYDEPIFDFSKRLGCTLQISTAANKAVKEPFRENLGALKLIVRLRNDLAHGNISFGECGTDINVSSLRDLRNRTVTYLQDVISSFQSFIQGFEFLQPTKRPSKANPL